MDVKVSVCIPIYKVENFIEKCARSLFEQTMQEGIEFIFVDDCSPDNSIQILEQVLEEYPHRKEQVKILHHDQNRGLVAARKTALAAACGDYIIHCDSDDWADANMYEELYHKAVNTDADMVYCHFWEHYSGEKPSVSYTPCYDSCDLFLKDVLAGKIHCSLWNKMFRAKIAQSPSMCLPDEICLSEDFLRVTQMLQHCRKIEWCDAPYYHYRRNRKGSYTDPSSYKIEYFTGTCKIIDILEKCLSEQQLEALVYFKAITLFKAVKHALLTSKEFHKLWKNDHKKMLICKSVPLAKRIILGSAFISYFCTSRICLLALKAQGLLRQHKN